jgi:signal transduction histidine kinase
MFFAPKTIVIALLLCFDFLSVSAQGVIYPDSATSTQIINAIYADQYEQAAREIDRIEASFAKQEYSHEYVKLLIDVSAAFNEKGEYSATQHYSFKALELALRGGYEDLQAEALIDIGYSYYFLEQLDKGIEYGEKALRLTTKLGLKALTATAHNLLGILHAKSKHEIGLIMDQYQKSLALRKELNDPRGIASTMSNMALELERQNRFEESLEMQLRSMGMDDSIGNQYGLAWSYQMTGALLIKMKQYKSSLNYLMKADSLASILKAREIQLQTHKSRSILLTDQKRFEEALHYANQYNSLRDSIYNTGLLNKVTFLQQAYETRERDKKIQKQQADLELQRMIFIVISIAGVIILVVLYFYYRLYRETLSLNKDITERNEEIQAQAEELRESNEVLHALNSKIAEQKEELQVQAEELTESNQTILNLNEKLNSDIEIKREELFKTNAELIKHNHELLQFSFTISHNLRGPVARILGLINIIALIQKEEEKRQCMKLLEKSTQELDSVLKDLTLVIDTRNALLKVKEKISFRDEWNKSFLLLKEYIMPEDRILVNFESLPFIYSTRTIIQSILYNLLSNAIRFRSPDRPLQIEVNTFRENGMNRLVIKDNGLGIDLARYKDDIFRLYKRFHTHVAGKGLGLYLVKTQVETMGGEIEVASELNKGCQFTLSLPDLINIRDQIILENDSATLVYDANSNTTVITWMRNITSLEYREVFDTVIQTLRNFNTPAWIADLRNQGVVLENDQKWFTTTVLPRAAECGLKRIAAIGFADPIRSQYYQNMVQKTAELKIDLRVFETRADANAWIEGFLTYSPISV